MIRPFMRADAEDFYAMAREFYSSSAVLHTIPEKNFYTTFEQIMQKSPFLRGYIFESDGVPAGYMLVSVTWSNEAGGICVWLEELYIMPEFRGMGMGTDAFALIEKEFPQVKRLRMEVTYSNTRAIKLYERLGFDRLQYLQMLKDL